MLKFSRGIKNVVFDTSIYCASELIESLHNGYDNLQLSFGI